MTDWNYQNLDDDVEELRRNLYALNEKKILQADEIIRTKNKKLEKSEKKLSKTIKKFLKR